MDGVEKSEFLGSLYFTARNSHRRVEHEMRGPKILLFFLFN